MAFYLALIDGESRALGVVVPDLPGCASAGDTVEDALRNAAAAVRLWCDDARADGEPIPQPCAREDVRRDAEIAPALACDAVLGLAPAGELAV